MADQSKCRLGLIVLSGGLFPLQHSGQTPTPAPLIGDEHAANPEIPGPLKFMGSYQQTYIALIVHSNMLIDRLPPAISLTT